MTMDFKYSEVVDPSLYETEGLCGGIDLRRSKFTELEDRGAIRAHQDWARHVGPCRGYRGGLGPEYSFISVVMPECIPERMEVVAFANEFAFMYDDVVECMEGDVVQTANDEIMNGFLDAAQLRPRASAPAMDGKAGKKQIQSLIFSEMLSIDPVCAKTTMKAWAAFINAGSAREHDVQFTSMAKYLPYRIKDVGEMYWYGVVTFGMGLRIPDHELARCQELVAPAWIAVGLQNDLWSWPKEVEAAKAQGKDHVINAIWVLMQEHGIDVSEAKKICRKLIKSHVEDYLATVETCQDDESLSKDLRQYLMAIKYSISGHIVWSLNCPRYNPEVTFSDHQRAWMRHGVPALDSTPAMTLRPKHEEIGYLGEDVKLSA